MRFRVGKSQLNGTVHIPGSKSHTIRAVAIASLADGRSRIRRPLIASDTLSSLHAYRLLGARIEEDGADWIINGVGGRPSVPDNVIDTGNSGTTLYIALGAAALADGCSVFTGDDQIRRRPAQPLIDALNSLGARVESTRGNGAAPIIVRGPLTGGSVQLDSSKTSQYLTSLLINLPLARADSVVRVNGLVEKPYIEMTLRWIEEHGISIERDDLSLFKIQGGRSYSAFDLAVPADFSSATFFMCAAAITGADLTLAGLDMNDTQGDKAVAAMLEKMGAEVEPDAAGLRIKGNALVGTELDLGDTPDALPALAVTACFAEGETRLINVAQARLKETDRISVMRAELVKLGADIEETPDGLVIRGSRLRPGVVEGHDDHRVIMALSVAGLAIDGETIINSADAVGVTFPDFMRLMRGIGADIDSD